MSQIVRQSNLFAGEDFTKVYKSFQEIDFTAYDFDTIKLALVEYVRVQYPEDFNDYIESSEFVAIIELLAYLGTSLAFRVDLNSRENIMDTAQRRESIIRLARLINYQPKRNIATNGLFKVNYLRTNQLLTDSAGNSLANVPVFWADPNNPDWFDQFVTVLNNALNPTNPFGRPSKSGTVGGISTDLYELNNVLGLNVTQPITITVNGESIPIDVVNATFVNNETFYEKDPNPQDPFGLIYRNDTLGVASADTGFFLYFKQGKLEKQDYAYDFPVPNRVQQISVNNINQRDVYVQEIDDQGNVIVQWKKVPSVSGTNVIYNSINFQERNIFEVISELNDQISVKFADGNFGNTPTGIYRYWYRTSAGRNVIIRPEDASNLQFTIPYNGVDGQTYNLTVNFSLENTIGNGSAAETNEQIKLRAPQTFYTQERMINNEDYNVFPLVFGNEITKIRAINRTYAGHSRYIDINDPTGYHTNITLLGEDGALYNDNEEQRDLVSITDNDIGNVEDEILLQLQQFAANPELENFYINNYISAFKGAFGQNYFVLPAGVYWKTSPDKSKNDTGYFIANPLDNIPDWPLGTGYSNVIATTPPYQYLSAGATIIFGDQYSSPTLTQSTLIKSVLNNGKPINPSVSNVGSIEISTEITDLWPALQSVPGFNFLFSESVIEEIRVKLNERQDFGLGYDLINSVWYIIDGANPNGEFTILRNGTQIDRSNVNGWLITVDYQAGDGQTNPAFELISRGTVTVFESLQQVRFFWDPDQKVFDSVTGKALQDEIQLLPNINTTAAGDPLTTTLSWTLSGVFIQDDGYQDPTKVEVVPADLNEDGAADSPNAFTTMVGPDDEVVFERYTNIDGYETGRPWLTGWDSSLVTVASQDLVLYGLETPNATIFDIGFEGQVQAPPVPPVRVSLADAGLFQFNPTIGPNTVDGVPVPATITKIASLLQQYLNWTGSNLVTVRENARLFIATMQAKTLRGGEVGTNILGKNYWNVQIFEDAAGQLTLVQPVLDENHWGRNGISFEQDLNVGIPYSKQLTYKWKHYAPGDQRVDPSVSNIIDVVVLTDLYYNEVIVWKDSYGNATSFPAPPTTEQLKIEFAELNKYKSISDELIYNSAEFKVLFGVQAEPELRATFKAVKIPTASISDNELKTRIIQAIDEYFDINNWDFGERFFYTELAAYIHIQLSKFLHSIVIVPEKEESQFGNLFEIIANPNQLFLSTATVDNVIIVKNYTETNLRV